MNKKSIEDLPSMAGQRVLTRVDFNVPIDDGTVADDTRIRAALPTINALRKSQVRVILMSHLGRPKGQIKPEFSLRPVAAKLSAIVNKKVPFADDCIGTKARSVVDGLQPGDVCLLENLRFHSGEEANDDEFSKELAEFGDIFVNDAFGAAHRAHASTVGITKNIQTCVAGLLMKRELEFLGTLLTDPSRPFYAVLGGAKVSGKLEVLTHLMDTVDGFIIGGGMAFTFLKAQGREIGHSLVENDLIDDARRILERASSTGKTVLLPIDAVAGANIDGTGGYRTVPADAIPSNLACFDIGAKTTDQFCEAIEKIGTKRGTIFWNGPMGVFETDAYAQGTKTVAEAIARATTSGVTTVVGGGDSVAAIHRLNVTDSFSHISTGGGASLEFMEGKTLPGVAALNDRE